MNSSSNKSDFRYKSKEERDKYIEAYLTELYDNMTKESFLGQRSLDRGWLIWKLPNEMVIKTTINIPPLEGYIVVYYFNGITEISLTHWHPAIEDVYEDLQKINIGDVFWIIKKKSLFKTLPMIIEKSRWERFSERKRNKYTILR